MIALTKVRELTLHQPIQEGRPAFLSAASGLVRIGNFLYVIADDENHLAVFRQESSEPGEVLRLFDGELSVDKSERKKAKPDLEAVTCLPAGLAGPHPLLLCMPSGSKEQRRAGALIPLDSKGAVYGGPEVIDLTQVFSFLQKYCGALNIEAVSVFGANIYFLNRGNKKQSGNAFIGFSLSAFMKSARGGASLGGEDLVVNAALELGDISGVPLTPTDAVIVSPGRAIFTAAAEATDNSYDDGACHGSAIGVLDLSGKPLFIDMVDTKRKLEGVDAKPQGEGFSLLLVNDEDSHTDPSELLEAHIVL